MLEIGRIIKYEIHIIPSQNKGFIVKVGCGTFVANSRVELLSYLNEYLENPKSVEDEYSKLGPQPETGAEADAADCDETERSTIRRA